MFLDCVEGGRTPFGRITERIAEVWSHHAHDSPADTSAAAFQRQAAISGLPLVDRVLGDDNLLSLVFDATRAWPWAERVRAANTCRRFQALGRPPADADAALQPAELQPFFSRVGLDEACAATTIGQLTGGQLARVVLAAASFSAPHLYMIDEPANLLERPLLEALLGAIRRFRGAVIVSSNIVGTFDSECREHWRLQDRKLTVRGATWTDEPTFLAARLARQKFEAPCRSKYMACLVKRRVAVELPLAKLVSRWSSRNVPRLVRNVESSSCSAAYPFVASRRAASTIAPGQEQMPV